MNDDRRKTNRLTYHTRRRAEKIRLAVLGAVIVLGAVARALGWW